MTYMSRSSCSREETGTHTLSIRWLPRPETTAMIGFIIAQRAPQEARTHKYTILQQCIYQLRWAVVSQNKDRFLHIYFTTHAHILGNSSLTFEKLLQGESIPHPWIIILHGDEVLYCILPTTNHLLSLCFAVASIRHSSTQCHAELAAVEASPAGSAHDQSSRIDEESKGHLPLHVWTVGVSWSTYCACACPQVFPVSDVLLPFTSKTLTYHAVCLCTLYICTVHVCNNM